MHLGREELVEPPALGGCLELGETAEELVVDQYLGEAQHAGTPCELDPAIGILGEVHFRELDAARLEHALHAPAKRTGFGGIYGNSLHYFRKYSAVNPFQPAGALSAGVSSLREMPVELRLLARGGRARKVRRSAAPLALLIGAVLLGGCGSSSSSKTSSTVKSVNLNTARVARSIQESILAQRHLHYHVTCPATVPQEQGRTFECVATGRDAKHKLATTPFLVTIQNKRGYVTYVGK